MLLQVPWCVDRIYAPEMGDSSTFDQRAVRLYLSLTLTEYRITKLSRVETEILRDEKLTEKERATLLAMYQCLVERRAAEQLQKDFDRRRSERE